MTQERSEQNPYEHWLAERRDAGPGLSLADEVMAQVSDIERQRQGIWWLLLVERIERSRAARWAVCSGALVVGGLPFLFLAHVSSL